MTLTFQFNWPLGKNSVRVSLGVPSASDLEKDFRIGAIPSNQQEVVWWARPGWVQGGNLHYRIEFDVDRGDQVVIDRRRNGSVEVETRNIWDTHKEWPEEADGPSMVFKPWYL